MNEQPSSAKVLREFGEWLQAWAEFVAAQAETGEAELPLPPAAVATPPDHWLADVVRREPPAHWLARVRQAEQETAVSGPPTLAPDAPALLPAEKTVQTPMDTLPPSGRSEPSGSDAEPPAMVEPVEGREETAVSPDPVSPSATLPAPAPSLAALQQWVAAIQVGTEMLQTQGQLPDPPQVEQPPTAVSAPVDPPPVAAVEKLSWDDETETAVGELDELDLVDLEAERPLAPAVQSAPSLPEPEQAVSAGSKTAVPTVRFAVPTPTPPPAPQPEPVPEPVVAARRMVLPTPPPDSREVPPQQPGVDLQLPPAPVVQMKSALQWVEAPRRLLPPEPAYVAVGERGEERPFFHPQTSHWPELPPERPAPTPSWRQEAQQQQRRQRLDAEQRGQRWNE